MVHASTENEKGQSSHLASEQGGESVTDVLTAARKRIEKPQHWLGHGWRGGAESFCASNAIFTLSYNAGLAEPAQRALAKAIGYSCDESETGFLHAIFRWNDAPERTHAEVLAAFDRAIEASRASPQTER